MSHATVVRFADLKANRELDLAFVPDDERLAVVKTTLDLLGLKKPRITARLSPSGTSDWLLTGTLGATVVQPCVATLAPVTTRIDEAFERLYTQTPPPVEDSAEMEMPEDDRIEPIPEMLDLNDLFEEVLALNLPLYPRVAEADNIVARVTEPGKSAMTDDDVKPFANLATLRDKLTKDGN